MLLSGINLRIFHVIIGTLLIINFFIFHNAKKAQTDMQTSDWGYVVPAVLGLAGLVAIGYHGWKGYKILYPSD
jgi:hypothetical protein